MALVELDLSKELEGFDGKPIGMKLGTAILEQTVGLSSVIASGKDATQNALIATLQNSDNNARAITQQLCGLEASTAAQFAATQAAILASENRLSTQILTSENNQLRDELCEERATRRSQASEFNITTNVNQVQAQAQMQAQTQATLNEVLRQNAILSAQIQHTNQGIVNLGTTTQVQRHRQILRSADCKKFLF